VATPAELEALSDSLRSAYELAWAAIKAEQDAIAADPAKFTRQARLRELRAAVDDRLDQVDETARAWLANEFPNAYRFGAESAAASLGETFRFTTIDTDAVTILAQDTFDELLAATNGVSDSTKALIRTLGKEQALLKTAAGKTVTHAARDLRRLLEAKGIYAVRYADGSKHGLADYTDMLIRTVTAKAHNAGTLNFGRQAGTEWFEVFDGFDCGWGSHADADKANGTIRHADDCAANSISHPRCQRAFGARPDITTPTEARTAEPSTTAEQRADQAASEQARREAQRTRRNTRAKRQVAADRRTATREARDARAAQRAADAAPPPDPPYPGGLGQKGADEWMRNRWGKDRIVILDGLGDAAADAMARTMDTLLRQFPATAADRIKVFGTSSKVTKALEESGGGHYRNISGRAYADAAQKAGMIRVNGTKAKKYAETTEHLKADVAAGFHPPGTDNYVAVVAHEFGHHLKWQAEAKAGKPAVKDAIDAVIRRHGELPDVDPTAAPLDKLQRGVEARTRYETIKGLSRYATQDYDELVGEALGEVIASSSPRAFAREIVEVMTRLAEGGV
jgi:hypothetical protein